MVTARLSFVPENQILFREIFKCFARRLTNRFVSQLSKVIRATVKRPLGSKAGIEPSSVTLKSATLTFMSPPIPVPSQTHWSSPKLAAMPAESIHNSPQESLIVENSDTKSVLMDLRIFIAFLPFLTLR